MGSLRFSIRLDSFDSKRFHFSANPFQFPDQFPVFSVTSTIPATRTFTIGSPIRITNIRVACLDTDANETENAFNSSSENDSVSGANVERSLSSKLKHRTVVTNGNKRGTKKDVARKFSFGRKQ